MAATSGAGGFSYAQAARGQKTGPTTQPTVDLSNTDSPRDWAEDVEASVKTSAREGNDEPQDTPTQESKASTVQRAKMEHKISSHSSGIPSPDLAASATSHDDASSVAQNGTSVSSWEAKSQSSETVVISSSEPAWIAERKERQGTQKADVPNGKNNNSNNTTIMPEQKPVVLQESAPPAVNPWAKRIEDAKVKTVTQTVTVVKPAATTAEPTRNPQPVHETKSSWQKPAAATQTSKDSRPADTSKGHRATKSVVAQPPSVKDQTSWPTPEVKQDVEKKTSNIISSEERGDDEASSGKPRKKTDWKPVPVVPNIIWETPGIHAKGSRPSPNGERAPRGGASTRGRGGARGASNAAHADRPQTQPLDTPIDDAARETSSTRDNEQEKYSKPVRKTAPVNGVRDDSSPNESTASLVDTQRASSQARTSEPKLHTAAAPYTNGVDIQSESTTPVETRKDSATKDWPSTRGTARRGRGRGGRGDLTNGHVYNSYVNGHTQEYAGQYNNASTFPRGGYNNISRGGYRVNGNRAQSLPFVDPMLRFNYMAQPQYSPMQQYSPVSDYNGYAMMPPAPYYDISPILSAVTQQLEYYFSIDNLVKDTFLRRNMDSQGFVLLEVVAAFNRLKQITPDQNMIKMASSSSEFIEIVLGDDGKERLRKAKDWEQWVLPIEERVTAVQNAGPQSFEHVHNGFQPPRQHMSLPFITSRPGDRRSYDFSYGMGSQMSPHAMFSPEFQAPAQHREFSNGTDDSRGRHSKSAVQENGIADSQSTGNRPEDHDVFPDDKIEQLTVCVMVSKETAPQYNTSSRTFSNGSIDAKEVEKEVKSEGVNGDKAPAETNGETTSDAAETEAPDLSVFWIKDNDQPATTLPSDLTHEPYLSLREKAFTQRNAAATGNCPYDMEVLYQFWSHFLIRNFNNTMYSEFVRLAHDDNNTRYSAVGQRNLAKYYDQAINSTNLIPLRVAKDYTALAKAESIKEGSNVFKNLHRAWRNGALNLRNRKRVNDVLDNELKQLLEG